MTTEAISARRPVIEPRSGDRPITTSPRDGLAFPHQQVTQIAPLELQDELVERATTLPHVRLGASCVSVPGSRAFRLDEAPAGGPPEAFQCGTEFAHVHPAGDGSLHLTLPDNVRRAAVDAGWGEPHPLSGTLLLFGPRTRRELETVWQLVLCSYRFALIGEES